MKQKLLKYSGLFIVFIFCFLNTANAQDYLPEKPKIQTSVYDNAKMMSGFEAKSLEQKLIKYNDTTSTQIVVVTVNSLEGNDIAMYATELAHKWGIGQTGKDNGILLVVSKSDRKVTIRTGYGVEYLLTDALSKRIITNIITPSFKQGDFYGGLDKGTSAIMQIMSGAYEGSPPNYSDGEGGIPIIFIFFLFFILMSIFSRKNRGGKDGDNNKGRKGGMSLLDAIILSNAGRGSYHGSGGFGGSSGGGFGGGGFGGGFGGGGFGGGGASGGW